MVKTRVRHENVSELLARRGISQNALAIKVNISSGYCSQLLRGTRCPSPSVRAQMMSVLGLGFDDLFEIVR
jgi:transcriptional regulator with XRE-family HTH domain